MHRCGVALPNRKWSNVCEFDRHEHLNMQARIRMQRWRDRKRAAKYAAAAGLPEAKVSGMRFRYSGKPKKGVTT